MAFAGIVVLGVLALISLALALPRGETGERLDVRRELRALLKREMLVAMTLTVMFAGSFFTLYTYVAPLLIDVTGASGGFVTVVLALIGIGLTLGNWLGVWRRGQRARPIRQGVAT